MAKQRSILSQLLRDLRDFVDLLVKIVSDDEWARDNLGFSVDVGPVSRLDTVVDALDDASKGDVNLAEYAEAAGRLAEMTEIVQLLVDLVGQDLPDGVRAEEAIGTILDTVSLGYLAGNHPMFLYAVRALGLLTENLPRDETAEELEQSGVAFWRVLPWPILGELLSAAGDAFTGPQETDDDARLRSVPLAMVGLLVAFTPSLVDTWFHRHIDPRSLEVLHGWEADPASQTPVADRVSERMVTLKGRVAGESTDAAGHPTGEAELELTATLAWVPREHGGPGLWVSLGFGGGRTSISAAAGTWWSSRSLATRWTSSSRAATRRGSSAPAPRSAGRPRPGWNGGTRAPRAARPSRGGSARCWRSSRPSSPCGSATGHRFAVAAPDPVGTGEVVLEAWQLARTADGRTVAWIGRRTRPGRGESSSGMGFDRLRPATGGEQ